MQRQDVERLMRVLQPNPQVAGKEKQPLDSKVRTLCLEPPSFLLNGLELGFLIQTHFH